MSVCPNCGYCDHCGRSRQNPYYNPYYQQPYITWTGTTNTLGGLQGQGYQQGQNLGDFQGGLTNAGVCCGSQS